MKPSTASRSTKTAERDAPLRVAATGFGRDALAERVRLRVVRSAHAFLDRVPEAARTSLLVLTLLLLVTLCTLLACRDHAQPAGRADFDLLDDPPSLTLNSTSAEPRAPAAPSDSERLTVVTSHFQAAPAVGELPESFAIPRRHHGDSPMMRNWKLLGLDLILVGALAAPVAAQEQVGTEPDKDRLVLQQLTDLKTSIDGLTKAVKEMQASGLDTSLKMQKAQGDIDGLKRQITQLQQEEIAGLRQQIVQLQRDLDDLNRRSAANPPRVATYPPPAQQPPATGRVRMINMFQAPMTVIVNGRAYNLNPGAIVTTDPLPVGTFSYEVLGVQAIRDRALAANETFSITIHP